MIKQATLTGHERELPTCEPPHYPKEDCQNTVDRVITVHYAGPANIDIDWWICEKHAPEVRETGKVIQDRHYSESKDGYGLEQ